MSGRTQNAPSPAPHSTARTSQSGALHRFFTHLDPRVAVSVFCVVLLSMLWIGVAAELRHTRARMVEQALQHNASLARAFEEHVVRSLKSIDNVLLFVKHEFEHNRPNADLVRLARETELLNPMFNLLAFSSERGDIVQSVPTFVRASIADRPYFKELALEDTGKLFIEKPVIGKVTGKQSLPMARRVNKKDGSFGGVAGAAVDPQYFSNFYRQVDIGSQGNVALVGKDGIVYARQAGTDVTVGQNVSHGELFTQLERSDSGSYISASAVDDVTRYFSYRALRDYPFIVVVGAAESEVLAGFALHRHKMLGGASAVTLVILALTVALLWMLTARKRIEQSLRQSERRYREIFDLAAVALREEDYSDVQTLFAGADSSDPHDVERYLQAHPTVVAEAANVMKVRSVNHETLKLYGARNHTELAEFLPAMLLSEAEGVFRRKLIALAQGKRYFEAETKLRTLEGEQRDVLMTVAFSAPGAARKTALVSMLDITGVKQAQKALVAAQREYEALVNSIDGIVWEADAETHAFTFVSQQAERLLGYPLKEWFETPNAWVKHLHPDNRDAVINYSGAETLAMRDHDFEYRMITAGGETVWLRTIVKVILENGAPVKLRGITVDVTKREQAEARIRYLAHHDALTGLPNRTLLQDRVNQAVAQASRNRSLVALLFIDLDHFKNINDSLGHHVGDLVLQSVATRLQGCVRAGDSLARLGGDEFIISLQGLSEASDAALVATKALEALDAPVLVEGHELHVSASIGISLYPTDGERAEELMRAADAAMYHAKEKGRGNFQFFTPALNDAVQRRLLVANQLRQALPQDEFSLYYQPQVDLESGRIYAVEALIRWRRADGSWVQPSEFVPIAEETGLILPIGEWALREACRQLKLWRDVGHSDLRMAVNLSARQLFHPAFGDIVARVLRETDVPASALELELTESMLMQPSEDNIAALTQLSGMGVQLSVDDFGIGYSSLAYLQRFPIHALKIDRSFINGIAHDLHDAAIVTSIIALARNLRLRVIAEGVENGEQAAFLKLHGCLAAQGYHFGQPAPAELFDEVLKQRTRETTTEADILE